MRWNRAAVLACVVVCASACRGEPQPSPDAAVAGAPAAPTINAGWVVTATDDTGAPSFVWSAAHEPLALAPADAARVQLERHRGALAVSSEALATLVAVRTVTTHGGSTVTTFRHVLGGIELYGRDTNVLLRADRSLVAIGGAPHAAALASVRGAFPLTADQAVRAALATLSITNATIQEQRVRPVYFAKTAILRPAYVVELMLAHGTDARAYRRVIAADTGAVLEETALTADAAFNYRVWADATRRPLDGPNADFTPHPTGNPDGSKPAPIASSLTAMDSFNAPLDPWLASNATVSTGNNVDAYTDRYAPDGFSGMDFRANTTSASTFDYTYDQTQSALANTTQTKAAIVSAFYITNWLHDYWYDSGFGEAAGNAQQNNFGRGGQGGDPMLVEVQDSADTQRDNANMSAMADGMSPKMQIYVWSPEETRYVRLMPGGDQAAGGASFGPQTFNTTGTVVLAVDGTAPTSDACEPLVNSAQLAGKIALIDRGTCTFVSKTQAAQGAGAIGVIIIDNVVAATPPAMGGTGTTTIPALSITKAAGDALKAQLAMGAVTATLFRSGGPLRDGALDTTVVAHEWGHYLHHRLASCSAQQCSAMSEGWGDFVALHELIRAGDPMTGTYAIGSHAGAADPNSWYWGLRRTPYTTTLAKNPLTFRHIMSGEPLPVGPQYNANGGDNAEVHNAGEIWAQMMFDAYAQILANPGTRSFAEAQRDMADYIVAGLAMTPTDATYTEQRDAVLAAAAAANGTDFLNLAQGFARRGAGSCAVSPPRTSTTFQGVVESFQVNPRLAIGAVLLDDSRGSCDRDGILDAQERGRMRVTITNAGPGALTAAQLSVATATAGVSFPSGTTAAIGAIAPLTSVTVTIDVDLAATFPQRGLVALDFTLTSNEMCVTTITKSVSVEANRDETPSATDSVESGVLAWTVTGADAPNVWARISDGGTNHAWRGIDLDRKSDTQLVSPSLGVGSGALTMTFRHRWQFEAQGGTNYDGGVIEVSTNGGTSWVDASTFATVGYTGAVTTTSGNVLGGRQAFVGQSAGFPTPATKTINFGTALANQTVLVRFRIGTDPASGAQGWTIDDIAFTGITNQPFRAVNDDMTVCMPPIANAGPDQTVPASSTVMLDGSASSDPNNDPLTYAWTQVSGPLVALSSTTAVKPTFTAPGSASVLTFQLTVSDGWASATDSVTITVMPSLVDAAIDAPRDAAPDARPDAPPDARPDAPPDAAVPADALVVDAPPDAPPLAPDAAIVVPDAAVSDAAPDAPAPVATGGGCCDARTAHPSRDLPLVLVVGFLVIRRRRR